MTISIWHWDLRMRSKDIHTSGRRIFGSFAGAFAALLFSPVFAQDFVRVEDEAGLGHVTNNHGVSVADYDLDGDLDIFLVGYNAFDVNDGTTWNRLLSNNGDGTFDDVTVEAGFDQQFVNTGIVAARGEKMGAAWGDYDNDGYPDLFLTNSRKDQLYHNEGNGTFVDVTEQAGVAGCFDCYSGSGLWWDHDRDGDLDLYVSILNGENIMYNNLGDGSFENVTSKLGLAGWGITWASAILDLDGDGTLDLYAINDAQENQLFENKGFGYREVAASYQLNDEGAGMGFTIGDYNNDGLFDIYITNIFNHHPNPLFTFRKNPRRFDDLAEEMGVANTGWAWGTKFFDCDHDGDEDLYAVNGVEPDQVLFGGEQKDENNRFFRNMLTEEGTAYFKDWSEESQTGALANARGLEVFDFDDDGDLDMLVANTTETPHLYRNETIKSAQVPGKNWIKIKLEGTISNRDAIGTKVKITIDGHSYYRWYQGGGFFSQSLTPVHFGVATADRIDEIEVTWPSGIMESIENVEVNQTLRLREGENTTVVTALPNPPTNEIPEITNYPNPFSASTIIRFKLTNPEMVALGIFSILGEEVYRMEGIPFPPGINEILWDGATNSGGKVDPGVYLYYLKINGKRTSGRLVKAF